MIKDIVVHLTGSAEDEVRLAYAEMLSDHFEAHLDGLYVHVLPEVVVADPAAMVGMEAWFEQSNAQAKETFKRLEARFERFAMPHQVRQFDVLAGTAGAVMATEARTADLYVATRPYGDPADEVHMEVPVLFGSGRACLFVPPKGVPPTSFGTVLIAWDGSREAARAVAEAMPFLKRAGEVIAIAVCENGEIEPGGDLARHLSRHGVSTVIETVDVGAGGPGENLLAEARRLGADLLVMGGYGHSRLHEWILGGATRHVLSNADIAVLMAR